MPEEQFPKASNQQFECQYWQLDTAAPAEFGQALALKGDFQFTVPLKTIKLQTQAATHTLLAIQVSFDGAQWSTYSRGAETDAESIDLANQAVRYVRLIASSNATDTNEHTMQENEFFDAVGIKQITFVSGVGVLAVPAPEWSDLLPQKEGWTGGDGIYSFDLTDLDDQSRVAFVFGDSFIGKVDQPTRHLVNDVMINNSMAVLDGQQPNPTKIRFSYQTDQNQKPVSLFTPAKNLNLRKDAYFWMQDGVLIGERLHFLPLIVVPNPEGREGFEFAFEGVVHLSVAVKDGRIDLDSVTQEFAPMRYRADNGKETIFTSAYLRKAHYPQADDLLYAYGVQEWETHRPVVARMVAKDFAHFDTWEYYNGTTWVKDPKAAVPVAPEVSSEFSVSYCESGFYAGKYVLIWQEWGPGGRLCMYTADRPEGPFTHKLPLYYEHEAEHSSTIYVYNAKAHLALSSNDELLVSYNVNTTSWDEHEENADIYHPRFVRLIQLQ
ncbi:DUF4185 domain-containing protein [Lacticaseibacillus jixiensis]|uniref:DUF4185 domain-containing protein n=1 Tax=Lacticaseibacillus jixiensis TaxID=3231926 RepID=UPI0036F1A22F